MKTRRLLAGTGTAVILSSILAYFAQFHRPFSETGQPFAFAYLGILATIASVVVITKILEAE